MGRHPRANNRCNMGHELTPENTYVNPRTGVKHCRECARAACKRYYDKTHSTTARLKDGKLNERPTQRRRDARTRP
jgi:hypothetical protein